MPMPTPRLFILRHGETEWSLNSRHTSFTDIPLTANGELRVAATAKAMVGNDRLIVPKNLAHIYVSPRLRAQRTFELLNITPDSKESLPWTRHGDPSPNEPQSTSAQIEVTEDIREWDYGAYEGLKTAVIREMREKEGIPGRWNIWEDGCVNGESPEEINRRLDRLIKDIRDRFHAPAMQDDATTPGDVLVVAHGHILRALAYRWFGQDLHGSPTFLMEAGGVGTLSYDHHNINEPAILLGGAFRVDIEGDN